MKIAPFTYMKRPFALIGFSYFTVLAVLIFVPENALCYLFSLFSALFLVSVIIKKTRKNKVLPIVLLTCVAAVSVYFINLNVNIKPVQKLDGTDATLSGVICDIPYKKNNRYNYTVEVENINQEKIRPFKIKLSSSEAIEGDIYDKFTGNVHFYIPQSNPAFDSQTYYRSKSIYINAFLYNYEENFTQKPEKVPPYYYILKLRQKMLSATKRILPVRTASVVNGILLGEKHEFPKDVLNNFDAIGAYHLIATSSIHLSILSQFFLWLFKKLKLGNRSAALLSALAVLLFMALTCFTPSVTRVGIMYIIYLLGLAIFKKPDSLNSLGIAVFLICLFNPDSALGIGLWLGFFSALGITLASEHINNFIHAKLKTQLYNYKVVRYIISIISVSLSVWIFNFPLLAWFFTKTSLISPISNVLLIPPVTVMINLSLILNTFSLLNTHAFILNPIALACGILTNFITYTSELLAKISFAMISLDYKIVNLWVAFTLLLISVSVYAKNLKKSVKLTALLSLNLAFTSVFSYQISMIGTTNVAIINCSNAIGFIISKNGRRAAVLCLNKDSNTTSIEYFLSKSYIKNIDYLNLSVLDNNHKTTAQDIIKTYHPKATVLSAKSSNELKGEEKYTHPVYFSGHVNSSFWEDATIETLEANNHTYMQVKISNAKFLIITNGGNIDDLPENWRNCNFFITTGLPANYQKIKSQNNVLSMNKIDSEINMQKFISSDNVFSIAHQGNLYINIKPSGEYDIRRSQ